MRKAVGNVSTLAVSILLSCLASAGASEQVKVVPEGGLAKDWILQPGHALAAPGYPATFADRGDDVCVAIGYRVQPDGTTSDYVMLGGWNSSRREKEPANGYWDAYSQAGAAAVSQWRFAPKPGSDMAAVDTVAVMTFRGESSTRTTDELRGKCAVPDPHEHRTACRNRPAMVAPGKGIIAIDESSATMRQALRRRGHREHRREPPRLPRAAADHAERGEYMSGAILFDETIRQSTKDGVPFAKYMPTTASSPASRSTRARMRWPASRAKWSPKASTACATA
jgi:hypothetical protein